MCAAAGSGSADSDAGVEVRPFAPPGRRSSHRGALRRCAGLPSGSSRREEYLSMLEAKDLWKAYGATTAGAGVSLTVGPGEIVGLLRPHRAGKSTPGRLLCRLPTPYP